MYNLAILYDERQHFKPSNKEFIEYLINIASLRDIHCVIIGEKHYDILQQFDGLFIRVTTSVNHYTFKFAQQALILGLDVIDNPGDIALCSNKIIQHKLLRKLGVHYPKTKIICKGDPQGFGYPYIVKTPDSCFGEGVFKIDNWDGFNQVIRPIFTQYRYLLAQEYLPTVYDWRIGVLNGKCLFALKYYIIPGDHRIVTPDKECEHETFPLWQVPSSICNLALAACKLIGHGFYGVDIKVIGNHEYVIEVNDNPSLDHGTEDTGEGDMIYHKILNTFSKKLV